jgi:hypothetical protein
VVGRYLSDRYHGTFRVHSKPVISPVGEQRRVLDNRETSGHGLSRENEHGSTIVELAAQAWMYSR